jgi:hypothetical protein
MGRQFAKYGAGLIAFYLGITYATGLGKVITSGANGTGTVVKTFQGRG